MEVYTEAWISRICFGSLSCGYYGLGRVVESRKLEIWLGFDQHYIRSRNSFCSNYASYSNGFPKKEWARKLGYMKSLKIVIIFYSLSGNTAKLAREIAQGVREVSGITVEIRRVPELLSKELFEAKLSKLKLVRAELEKEFPEATIDDLINADGVAFGTPVHFGSFASQIKQFIDQLSPVWVKGQLVNKPAAVFCSGAIPHGGEEATLLSLIIPLMNLGMIPIGIPYPIQGEGSDFDAGSPYGAIFTSGSKGEKEFSEGDKKVARILGRRLATMVQILNCGCDSCNVCYTMTRKIH